LSQKKSTQFRKKFTFNLRINKRNFK